MLKYVLALYITFQSFDGLADKVPDQVQFVSEDDRNMNLAIAEARRTLDDFLYLSKNPPDGATNFKLKVMLSDNNGVEHFWFMPFEETKDGFAGVLANDPSVVKSVAAGEVYPFERDQITDWGYELNGKQIGSFTVCAIFKSMPNEDVERYKRDHGFVCES